MFDQILVPVDRSLLAEHILPHVRAIASAHSSKVTLISVLDPALGNTAEHPTDPFGWRIQRAEAEVYLDKLSSDLGADGLEVQTVLLEGKAPDQVIQYSNRMGCDLIMLSSHGQGGLSSWNNSSVMMKIIQQAYTSVMIIRSSSAPEFQPADQAYRRILAPFDGSRRAEYGLYAAANLAVKLEAELMIVHVVKPPELLRRTPLSAQDRSLVQKVVESNRREGLLYLDTLKNSLSCPFESRLIVNESVNDALHTVVVQEEIDLVVLSAHGSGGNPRWPYGNITTNFLTYSTVPLLIVQDFSRADLYQFQAKINSNEDWNRQRPLFYGSNQRF